MDRHVVVVSEAGSFTLDGSRLTGPVDSIDKLRTLIGWARGQGFLQPMPGNGRPGRVWVVGPAWRGLTGLAPEPAGGPDDVAAAEVVSAVGHGLGVLAAQGWELRGDGAGSFTLIDLGGVAVEVLVEPTPWLAGGDPAVAAGPAELGRRLLVWAGELGELPAVDAAQSGAAIFDAILAARAGRRGAVAATPGVLPVGVDVETAIQPAWTVAVGQAEAAFTHAEDLVLLRQEAGVLASAGMAMLGHGTPRTLSGPAAAAAAADAKPPFGVWRVVLPALAGLGLPEQLPAPHPRMRHSDATPAVWLTTEDLALLGRDPRDGGAGLAAADVRVDAAVIWPQQGRLLESWTARIRQAREHLAADTVMAGLVETAADAYLAALADPDRWADRPGMSHHFQPAWWATIAARTRARSRRAAARISREYRVRPLWAAGTELIYAVDLDPDTGGPVDLSDTTTVLGRFITAARAPIGNDTILEVLLAETPEQIANALTTPLDVVEPHHHWATPTDAPAVQAVDAGDPAAEADTAAEPAGVPGDAGAEPAAADNPPARPRRGPVRAATGTKPDTQARAKTATKAAPKVAPKSATKAGSPRASAGIAAAVLHTDGLWLPDGTRIDIDTPIVHAGQIADLALRLAETHQLGYRLGPTYVEAPQIWMTADMCETVGIDVDAIDTYKAAPSLRTITEGIDFVTLAAAGGWRFGGVKDNEAPRLGIWTRLYRGDDKRGVLLAVIPAMSPDDKDMPIIFGGEETPHGLARRLQYFADALGQPWSTSAGTTGINLIKNTRPRTYTFDDWVNRVFAPSAGDVPYGLDDVETDFNWSRNPDAAERRCRFVHAYDRGASYPAAIPGLELPIGEPVHHPEPIPFNPKTPGYWRIVVPEAGEWRMPYVLNPVGLKIHEPKWVTTPRLQRAIGLGYDPEILEAIIWPEHGRVLNGWYERLRDAAATLDRSDPDQASAYRQTKVVRNKTIGLMGSQQYLGGKTGYSPERRFHIMAKANSNMIYAIAAIGQTKHARWPVAVLKDTILYISDEPNPQKAWPGDAAKFGTGSGQYKWEGSALLAEHLTYLDGGSYRGKEALIEESDDWSRAVADLISTGDQ